MMKGKHCLIFVLFLYSLFLSLSNVIADVNDGLISFYSFNGNANDMVGDNHGTIVGAILAEDRFGNPDNAYSYDGIDDYIDLGFHLSNSNEYSLALWFYLDKDTTNSFVTFLSVDEGAKTPMYTQFDHRIYRKKIQIDLRDNYKQNQIEYDSNQEILLHKWYFVAFTFNGSTSKLYINGELDNSKSLSTFGNIETSIDYKIGVMDDRGMDEALKGWFKGVIDDFRIYNRYLSETEIQTIYQQDQDQYKASISGKVITSSEILSYTANVGGATIRALPYDISTTSNIYGEFKLENIPLGKCIIEIESSYFETVTQSTIVDTENDLFLIQLCKPKCKNMYTQEEVDEKISQIVNEKDTLIFQKEQTISQLNQSISLMYTQGQLDKAILEAEKRGELKYDINGDGKVGLEEVIKYLETISGVRVESLIIFPEQGKYFIN